MKYVILSIPDQNLYGLESITQTEVLDDIEEALFRVKSLQDYDHGNETLKSLEALQRFANADAPRVLRENDVT
jgi:hypothetical protein